MLWFAWILLPSNEAYARDLIQERIDAAVSHILGPTPDDPGRLAAEIGQQAPHELDTTVAILPASPVHSNPAVVERSPCQYNDDDGVELRVWKVVLTAAWVHPALGRVPGAGVTSSSDPGMASAATYAAVKKALILHGWEPHGEAEVGTYTWSERRSFVRGDVTATTNWTQLQDHGLGRELWGMTITLEGDVRDVCPPWPAPDTAREIGEMRAFLNAWDSAQPGLGDVLDLDPRQFRKWRAAGESVQAIAEYARYGAPGSSGDSTLDDVLARGQHADRSRLLPADIERVQEAAGPTWARCRADLTRSVTLPSGRVPQQLLRDPGYPVGQERVRVMVSQAGELIQFDPGVQVETGREFWRTSIDDYWQCIEAAAREARWPPGQLARSGTLPIPD